MKNSLIICLLACLVFSTYSYGQLNNNKELACEVNKVFPPFAITKANLNAANTLQDLNRTYKPDWVKSFVSMEITAQQNGKQRKAIAKDDKLTSEQKALISNADPGTLISVDLEYWPDNNLSYNEVQEFKFQLPVDPDIDASFPGGATAMEKYLKEKVLEKIPEDIFKQYQLAAVSFTIDEKGKVDNPSLSWSSEDEKVDKILLDAICNMPDWKPAQYNNGLKVKQDFAFSVGDMESCTVNLLNIIRR